MNKRISSILGRIYLIEQDNEIMQKTISKYREEIINIRLQLEYKPNKPKWHTLAGMKQLNEDIKHEYIMDEEYVKLRDLITHINKQVNENRIFKNSKRIIKLAKKLKQELYNIL